jgi:hypothetical protein
MSARQHRGTPRRTRPPVDEIRLIVARVRAGAPGAGGGVWADARALADEVDRLRAENRALLGVESEQQWAARWRPDQEIERDRFALDGGEAYARDVVAENRDAELVTRTARYGGWDPAR